MKILHLTLTDKDAKIILESMTSDINECRCEMFRHKDNELLKEHWRRVTEERERVYFSLCDEIKEAKKANP